MKRTPSVSKIPLNPNLATETSATTFSGMGQRIVDLLDNLYDIDQPREKGRDKEVEWKTPMPGSASPKLTPRNNSEDTRHVVRTLAFETPSTATEPPSQGIARSKQESRYEEIKDSDTESNGTRTEEKYSQLSSSVDSEEDPDKRGLAQLLISSEDGTQELNSSSYSRESSSSREEGTMVKSDHSLSSSYSRESSSSAASQDY